MEGKIYGAIANVMKDVGAVGKSDKNDYDKYMYRGIDAVMNALNPAMVKNHVFVTPSILESHREERSNKQGNVMVYSILTVKYTFYTDDGSYVECTVIGEAMDRSDKSTNKAMSAAFKYACFQTFCIPTEEMIDSESESLEMPENKKAPKEPKKVDNKKSDAELNKEMIESVPADLLPDPSRTPEYRAKRIREEIARTKQDEKRLLDNARVEKWEDVSDVQFITLMAFLAKR